MRSVFAALQWAYERIVYNLEKRRIRTLNKYYAQHENEIKYAFFRLGAMNVRVDTNSPSELFDTMNEDNTNSSLFSNYEDKNKTLNSCEYYFEILNEEYIKGNEAFQEGQQEIEVCAQKSAP